MLKLISQLTQLSELMICFKAKFGDIHGNELEEGQRSCLDNT
jgi:hypothetical protein